MVRHVGLGELAISTAGVALRRAVFTVSDQDAEAAMRVIARAMAGLSHPPWSYGYELVEADASTGYGVIAGAYDRAGGPDIDAEQPAMWELFDGCQPVGPWMSRVGPADTSRASPSSGTTSWASISLRRC